MTTAVAEARKVRVLVDTTGSVGQGGHVIVETREGGKVVLKGEFAKAETVTANNRMYPREVLVREVNRLQKEAQGRKLFGELDHPADGRTQFQRVSHIIRDVRLESDGRVLGEMEVIETAKGKDLKAIIEAGGAIGVSSRGTGTTSKRADGVEVVNEDYNLITFDVVADPAHAGSYPEVFFEHTEARNLGRVDMPEETAGLDELVARDPKIAAQVAARVKAAEERAASEARESSRTEDRESLRSSMEKEMLDQIAMLRKEVEAEVREDVMTDPKVADAKKRLEAIRAVVGQSAADATAPREDVERLQKTLSEREARIASLEKQSGECRSSGERLRKVAKQSAYELYMERVLAGNPAAEEIRKLADQSVRLLEDDAKTIQRKVGEAIATWAKITGRGAEKDRRVKEITEQLRAEIKKDHEALETRIKALEGENTNLKKVSEKSLAVAQELALESARYRAVEELAGTSPARHKIRRMVESANPRTEGEIRRFVEEATKGEGHDSALLESVRRSVARGTRPTTDDAGLPVRQPIEESTKRPAMLHGVSLDQIRRLSGIKA